MDTDKFLIVDYSDKAIAVPGEYETALLDEFKLIGGRFNSRLKFGAGWIFSKSKCEDQIKQLFTAYEIVFTSVALSDIASVDRATNADELPEYIKIDKNDVIVTLEDGGQTTIKSRPLKTEFWFGYSDCGQGPTSDECHDAANKARTDENYFISENTDKLRDMLNRLNDNWAYEHNRFLWLDACDTPGRWYLDKSNVCPDAKNAVDCLHSWQRDKYGRGQYRKLSADDKGRLLAGYNHALALREKRCRAYLKRYGLSKIHVHTYWMDR